MNRINFWASDFSLKSGEGKLARMFVNKLKQKNTTNKIIQIKSRFTKNDGNLKNQFFSSFLHKYLIPLYGAFRLWVFYFRGGKICYLNYLPLWNFTIFLLLPPKCILGPITGTIDKQAQFFLKKLLENISALIIKIRYKKIIFANNFYQDKFKNHFHNFIMSDFGTKNTKNKNKFDFIFYIRDEFLEKNTFIKNLIEHLSLLNYKIVTIGGTINIRGVKNFGYCGHKKTQKIISSCKYSVANRENLYSFFTQDCLKNNLIVFYNEQFKQYEQLKLKNFNPINFDNHNLAIKRILLTIKTNAIKNNFKKINFSEYFNNLI
tara:strand:+ start:497 stop:1453 length:957 start_codon:yes stop_codon:yes gene_type:complete